MAMKFGVSTTIMGIGRDFVFRNDNIFNGFNNTTGLWITGTAPLESEYLDIGFVTDEREELSIGGVAYSFPGEGTNSRIFLAIGGKILRVTITGIIPDGLYGSAESSYNGKSNSSVFKYKLNKYFAYQKIVESISDINLLPHLVQYRRKYIYETEDVDTDNSEMGYWILTSYSTAFINGTRNISYTITLDQSNNFGRDLNSGINVRSFGDID